MRFSSDSSSTGSTPPPGEAWSPRQGLRNPPTFEPPLRPLVRPAAQAAGEIPKFDMKVLEAIGIDHVDPRIIAEILAEEDITLHELKIMIDAGMHEVSEEELMDDNPDLPPLGSKDIAEEWDPSMVEQLNPRRRFMPGTTYEPKDLSPLTKTENRRYKGKKQCPLGGKKGPKIDFANIELLSRFLTDGGRIIGRRKSGTCAKKQRELTRAIKRARIINLLPYMHKPREYIRKDTINPLLEY